MKIALVNKIFSTTHGGGERMAHGLATVLAENGHEVHLFALRVDSPPEGVIVHEVKVARKPAFKRILSFAENARKQIGLSSFDIVYGLTQFWPQDIQRMGGGIHRHWLKIQYPNQLWRWLNCLLNTAHIANLVLEKNIYRPENFRRIVTNSRLCSGHAQRYYNVPEEKIRVLYNGVDHDLFNRKQAGSWRDKVRNGLGLAKTDICLTFISTNWRRKGLTTILRAMSLLGEKGNHVHLTIVGRGNERVFSRLVARLGLASRCHFIGPTSEVVKYYGACDLLVLPTLYDPFANVCLEAMACGKPVITSRENGASEIIVSGENGFVLEDPKDSSELACLLGKCLEPGVLNKLADTAQKTAVKFSWDRCLAETLELFDEVLREKLSFVEQEMTKNY